MTERTRIFSGSRYEDLAGYARAVVDGRWVFVSGTVGADYATGSFADGAAAQAELALTNIRTALDQAGSKLEDVVRVRVIIPDQGDFAAVAEVLRRHFHAVRPANTTWCAPLVTPEMKVEIEVTALKPED